LGIAADIKLTAAQSNWLAKNGARFGLRRPMSYEPWHIEEGG
jgi:LAS superfamily LD-carboxypeptidase LdcB